MTTEELLALLDAQRADLVPPRIAGLLVAPDVWAKLSADLPRTEAVFSTISWKVTVDKWLPPGMIVPVDEHGRPIPKPTAPPSSTPTENK